MTGWEVLTIFIICLTVIGVVSILSYAAWSIFTNKDFQKFLNGKE